MFIDFTPPPEVKDTVRMEQVASVEMVDMEEMNFGEMIFTPESFLQWVDTATGSQLPEGDEPTMTTMALGEEGGGGLLPSLPDGNIELPGLPDFQLNLPFQPPPQDSPAQVTTLALGEEG